MTWYLRNENSAGPADVARPFRFGAPGWVPVVGDWTGTGHTGIGVFDPSTGTWYLRNETSAGPADAGVFRYGAPGWLPVAGDWGGSGHSGIGVVNPDSMTWYLRDTAGAGVPNVAPFRYGGAGWQPVVGDWDGDGRATVGVVDPRGAWYLRNHNGAGSPSVAPFAYGLGSWAPLAGAWVAPLQAQLAAGGAGTADRGAAPLTEQDLLATVAAALSRLQAAGVAPALLNQLAAATYVVTPLGGAYLGLTDVASRVAGISPNAAGYGWFVDTTPLQDEEFSTGGPGGTAGRSLVAQPGNPAAGKMDLLTVVLHEMGHLAGRADVGAPGLADDLMAETLTPGTRRVDALDQVFGHGT
jgi:hypothetical protein